jgi:hypothetical protein
MHTRNRPTAPTLEFVRCRARWWKLAASAVALASGVAEGGLCSCRCSRRSGSSDQGPTAGSPFAARGFRGPASRRRPAVTACFWRSIAHALLYRAPAVNHPRAGGRWAMSDCTRSSCAGFWSHGGRRPVHAVTFDIDRLGNDSPVADARDRPR